MIGIAIFGCSSKPVETEPERLSPFSRRGEGVPVPPTASLAPMPLISESDAQRRTAGVEFTDNASGSRQFEVEGIRLPGDVKKLVFDLVRKREILGVIQVQSGKVTAWSTDGTPDLGLAAGAKDWTAPQPKGVPESRYLIIRHGELSQEERLPVGNVRISYSQESLEVRKLSGQQVVIIGLDRLRDDFKRTGLTLTRTVRVSTELPIRSFSAGQTIATVFGEMRVKSVSNSTDSEGVLTRVICDSALNNRIAMSGRLSAEGAWGVNTNGHLVDLDSSGGSDKFREATIRCTTQADGQVVIESNLAVEELKNVVLELNTPVRMVYRGIHLSAKK